MGPYAWQWKPAHTRVVASGCHKTSGLDSLPVVSEPTDRCNYHKTVESGCWDDKFLRHADLATLTRSQDVFRKIEMDPSLHLSLPKPGSTAGRVLQHAVQEFERLLNRHKPMTCKFGITHDAAVRWHNATFGYKHSIDRFQGMLVLYGASNPHGPAFLEAALIDRFGSVLTKTEHIFFSKH